MDYNSKKKPFCIEGVVEYSKISQSVRKENGLITKFLLVGDERTYIFPSETREIEGRVRIYFERFNSERAVVECVELLDKKHKVSITEYPK